MNVKNKPALIFITVFTLFKSIMLDIIFKSFIRNINDHEIQKKIIYDMIIINRFFRFVYNFIEKVKRINVKIQKLIKKENKSNELLFYKSLIKKIYRDNK